MGSWLSTTNRNSLGLEAALAAMRKLLDRYFNRNPRLRRFVTKLLEGDHDLTVQLFTAEVRVNSVKEHGYLRASRLTRMSSLLRDEVPVLQTLAYFMGGADSFVDIGANVGVYCALLAKFRRLHPMPFYAFEANPDTYRRLVETVARIGVETFDCAVSDHEGTLYFVPGAVSHVFTTVDKNSRYSLPVQPVRVPCRRLDSFPIRGGRMIVKIDVEGQEFQVLEGMTAFFDQTRVFVCYIDGFEDPAVPLFLRDRGFSLFDGRSLEERPKGDCYSLLAVQREAI